MKLVSADIVANCEEDGTQPVGHYGGGQKLFGIEHQWQGPCIYWDMANLT